MAAAFAGLVIVFAILVGGFMPASNGKMGTDYSYFLPSLLEGSLWFHANGPFAVPWFSPSFCAGVPFFPNPQNLYYSVPQMLALAVSPVTAVWFAAVLFGGLGAVGTWALLRSTFRVANAPSLLGAALFLFNGFFLHRMIVGHLAFHAFMLTPWVALFLTRPHPAGGWGRRALDGVAAGVVLTYMGWSGMVNLLVPVLLCVGGLGFTLALHRRVLGDLVLRFAVAGVVSFGLCAAKLVAAFSYAETVKRTFYALPAIDGLSAALWVPLRALFWGGAELGGLMKNHEFPIDRHEFEYSVSLVPLVLVVGAAALRRREWRLRLAMERRSWAALAVGGVAAIVPLALNYYHSGWSAFLKRLPLFDSSANLLRWYSVYILPLCLAAGVAVERTAQLKQRARIILVAGTVLAIGQAAMHSLSHDLAVTYNPVAIQAVQESPTHRIPAVTGVVKPAWNLAHSRDAFVLGNSQLHCYEPMFGYRGERLVTSNVHEGPALDESEGSFNFKNPACYVFPEENRCRPGDNFPTSKRAQLEAFLERRPFEFTISRWQAAANVVSITTWALLGLGVVAAGVRRLVVARQRPTGQREAL